MTTVEADKSYTEEDWAPDSEKIQDTYARSKMLAEKAAWDFIKELPGMLQGSCLILALYICWIFI